jgi:hypothetical protein
MQNELKSMTDNLNETVPSRFLKAVEKWGDRVALRKKEYGLWHDIQRLLATTARSGFMPTWAFNAAGQPPPGSMPPMPGNRLNMSLIIQIPGSFSSKTKNSWINGCALKTTSRI